MDNNRTLQTLVAAATLCACSAWAQSASPWVGTWKGSSGELLVVHENTNVLDGWGVDPLSIYRVSCVVDAKDSNIATCVGDGVNHGSGNRFTYRSRLKRELDGRVSETWEAHEREGAVSGQAVYTRQPPPAKK